MSSKETPVLHARARGKNSGSTFAGMHWSIHFHTFEFGTACKIEEKWGAAFTSHARENTRSGVRQGVILGERERQFSD